jgi:hypothetical protein
MNPLLAAGAGAFLVSDRGRQLVRRGMIFGLAQLIAAGETAAKAAAEATATAGNVATDAAGTAQHGAGSVVSAFTGIVDEAKAHAHEGNGAEQKKPAPTKRTTTRKRRTPAK